MTKIEAFKKAEAESPFAANRLLFEWLSDDKERADLYRDLLGQQNQDVLKFQSRADVKARATDPGASEFHQDVYLLTSREHIDKALSNATTFSNAPYRALGSGTFMLGLDEVPDHQEQRKFAGQYLKISPTEVNALARAAFLTAAVLPLKQRAFDLAGLVEQVALRFAGFLFGYGQADHGLLEQSMRLAYRGLNYQIIGRHFASEPGAILGASAGMGELLKRTAELIDMFRHPVGKEQEDELKQIDTELKELRAVKQLDKATLQDFKPVLRRIAEQDSPTHYSCNELAVIVVGMIAGAVHNIQSSVSIAIEAFFQDEKRLEDAREAARDIFAGKTDEKLKALIWEALRLNPPAAFLHRVTVKEVLLGSTLIPAGRVVLLAMGAAARDIASQGPDEFRNDRGYESPYVFGGTSAGPPGLHQCVGKHLAMPVIVDTVKRLLLLQGATPALDPLTGQPQGLTKLWGIMCQRYPFEHDRGHYLKQSPLIVVMKVKTPLSVHAEALKKVIQYGAPRIEKKLIDAKHVHFASFLFIENDTKLVLHTVYDGDFDAYIEHFALEIGSLFDRLFEHIEDAPPMPVCKYPKEFVDTIRRYNAPPAGGYFFSAYPRSTASMICHEFNQELP
jgi:cytochrome P450